MTILENSDKSASLNFDAEQVNKCSLMVLIFHERCISIVSKFIALHVII